MAYFRCIGGNGSAPTGSGMSLIDYSENAYQSGAPSAYWTSKTFTADNGDLFIISVISRGNVTISGASLVDAQEFGGAGDKLQVFKKVSAGGSEQFVLSIANRVRDEIMIFQLRGVSSMTKTSDNYSNSDVTQFTANIGAKSIMLAAKRYSDFTDREYVTNYIGASTYAQNTGSSGTWLLGIINNDTLTTNNVTIKMPQRSNPYAYFVYSLS